MFLLPVRRHTPAFTRSLDRLFDDSFDRFLNAAAKAEPVAPVRTPALDVAETDTAYVVELDMPGIAKEQVKISIDGRRVNVETETAQTAEKKDEAKVLYRERSNARFARSLVLPTEVNQAESVATMEGGVLTLTLTKRQLASASTLSVS